MATQKYMTGATRASIEEEELKAAEQAYAESIGTAPHQEDTRKEEIQEQDVQQEKPSEVDWEKRYKDLQSHADKTKNELMSKLKEAGVEPEESDRVAEMELQLAELRSKDEQRETLDLVARAQEAVHTAHPDFVQVINSSEFAEWIKTRPQVYQDAIYDDRPDAAMASDALTLFKVQSGYNDRKAAQANKQLQDQAALSVGGGHREVPASQQEKVWSWNEIQSLTPSEYDKLESVIDKALQEGRVR